MNARYDYQQQELERERYERTLEALDRVAKAGLEDEAKFLAGECGVKWKPHAEQRTVSLGK